MKLKDKTGQIFGHLSVIKYLGMQQCSGGKSRTPFYLCRCSCGKEVTVGSGNLSARSKSCGCLRVNHGKKLNATYGLKYSPEEACKVKAFKSCKRVARNRHHSFDLSLDQFCNIIGQNCYYCGQAPDQTSEIRGFVLRLNGLDRKNSEEGYSIENVAPCCKRCNVAKNNMSSNAFIAWAARVCNHRTKEIYGTSS